MEWDLIENLGIPRMKTACKIVTQIRSPPFRGVYVKKIKEKQKYRLPGVEGIFLGPVPGAKPDVFWVSVRMDGQEQMTFYFASEILIRSLPQPLPRPEIKEITHTENNRSMNFNLGPQDNLDNIEEKKLECLFQIDKVIESMHECYANENSYNEQHSLQMSIFFLETSALWIKQSLTDEPVCEN